MANLNKCIKVANNYISDILITFTTCHGTYISKSGNSGVVNNDNDGRINILPCASVKGMRQTIQTINDSATVWINHSHELGGQKERDVFSGGYCTLAPCCMYLIRLSSIHD